MKIAILAGGQHLPVQLAEACKKSHKDFVIIAFEGHGDADLLSPYAPHWVRLGAMATIEKILAAEGVTHIVLAGAIKRPSFKELKPDWRAATFLAKNGFGLLGDDSLLTKILSEIERGGYTILGAHDILTKALCPGGWLTPNPTNAVDLMPVIYKGFAIAKQLGTLDVGQSIVIQDGIVLAVEAIEGTDNLIKRSKDLCLPKGGPMILVKTTKPQQDNRADMPTIGPKTIHNLINSGFSGLVIEANSTLFLNQSTAIEQAKTHNLWVLSMDDAELKD
jgi:DUF1009 family protein